MNIKEQAKGLLFTAYILATALKVLSSQRYIFTYIVRRTAIKRIVDPYLISPQYDIILTIPLIIYLAYLSYKDKQKIITVLTLLAMLSPILWILPTRTLALLAGILAICSTITLAKKQNLTTTIKNQILYFFIILETYALAYWTTAIIAPHLVNLNPRTGPANLELELFHSLDVYLPHLTLIFLYAWIPVILNKGKPIPLIKDIWAQQKQLQIKAINPATKPNKKLKLIATLTPLFAFTLGLIPLLPTTNPNFISPSVDIAPYSKMLQTIDNSTDHLKTCFNWSDRPLTLMIMYSAWKLTGLDAETYIKILLPFMTMLIPIASYLYALHYEEEMRYYSTILSLFTTQMLVGIWSGFYSNIIGLLFLYPAQALSIQYIEKNDTKKGIASAILLTLTLLAHSWTYYIGILIITTYTLLDIIQNKNPRQKIISTTLVIIPSIITETIKTTLLQSSSLTYTATITAEKNWFSLKNIHHLFANLEYLHTLWHGGYNATILLLIIATIGILLLDTVKNNNDKLLLAWLIPTSIIFLLSNTVVQSRFLYLIPMQVITTKALTRTKNQKTNMLIILALMINTIRSILNTLKLI